MCTIVSAFSESPGCRRALELPCLIPLPHHVPSPAVTCLAQEEGKGISWAAGSALSQSEQWKGSFMLSLSLSLLLSQDVPVYQDDDGLQRGTVYILLQGCKSYPQGSPASLPSSSHDKPIKSFPLLLKENPSSLPQPHAIWPHLPRPAPFPSLIALPVPSSLPPSPDLGQPFPTSGCLPTLLFLPGRLLLPALPTAASFSSFSSQH